MARTDADKTLFERWLDHRDDDSFAEIARRHGPLVFDLAVRACGDRAVAEDVLQEALLNLALERTAKPIEVGLVAWLARFAISRARNQRASEVSRARRQRVVGGRRTEDVMPDSRLERREELDRVLERAEPEERVVLAMRYLHGWGYSRIAGALSVSEGAARVRVHRALRSVRSRVAGGSDRSVMAGIMALPVITPTPSSLEITIGSVLERAHSELGTASASAASGAGPVAPINRVARLLWKGAGLGLLAVGLGTTAAPERLTAHFETARADAAALVQMASFLDGEAVRRGSLRTETPTADAPRPRPEGWDTGAIERLGRGEVEIGAPVRPTPTPTPRPPRDADETPATTPSAPAHAARTSDAPNRPSDTSRPKLREACAARCDPVSSDGERAGVSAGPSVPTTTPTAAEPSAETSRRVAADSPSADRGASGGRPPLVALDALAPEQLELVEQASALLAPLVTDDLVSDDLAGLVTRPHKIKKRKRSLRRQFRKMRREVREAAASGDVDAMDAAAAKSARLSVVNDVLDALLSLAVGDRRPGGRKRKATFPNGVAVTRALEEVVRVLDAVDRRLPGGLESLAPTAQDPTPSLPTEVFTDAPPTDTGTGPATPTFDPSRLPGGMGSSSYDADRLPGGMLPTGGE